MDSQNKKNIREILVKIPKGVPKEIPAVNLDRISGDIPEIISKEIAGNSQIKF